MNFDPKATQYYNIVTIGKGNGWNIINYHGKGDFFGKFHWKVIMTLEATWLAGRHYG